MPVKQRIFFLIKISLKYKDRAEDGFKSTEKVRNPNINTIFFTVTCDHRITEW